MLLLLFGIAAAVTVAAAAAGDVRLSSGLIEHAAQFFDMFSICLICQVAFLLLLTHTVSGANGNDMPKKKQKLKKSQKDFYSQKLSKLRRVKRGHIVVAVVVVVQSCLRAC